MYCRGSCHIYLSDIIDECEGSCQNAIDSNRYPSRAGVIQYTSPQLKYSLSQSASGMGKTHNEGDDVICPGLGHEAE